MELLNLMIEELYKEESYSFVFLFPSSARIAVHSDIHKSAALSLLLPDISVSLSVPVPS